MDDDPSYTQAVDPWVIPHAAELLAGAAATAVVVLTPRRRGQRPRLDTLSRSAFAEMLGQTFTLSGPLGTVRATLDEVGDVVGAPPARTGGSRSCSARRPRFEPRTARTPWRTVDSARNRCSSSRSIGAPRLGCTRPSSTGPDLLRRPFMTAPFLGEIKMVGFNFAPRALRSATARSCRSVRTPLCSHSSARPTGATVRPPFALPDLRSRVPLHVGQGPGLSSYALGQVSGTENVALNAQQLAPHSHTVNASATATSKSPANNFPAVTGAGSSYAATADGTTMNPAMTTGGGGGQPHTNLQPSLCINFVIALEGIFPSRN